MMPTSALQAPAATGPTINTPVSPVGETPAMTELPTYGVDLASAPKAQFTMAAGKQLPTSDIVDRVAAAWASVLGAENVRLTGVSGKRSFGGKGRHPAGLALDYQVSVKTPTGWRSLDFGNKDDLSLMDNVAEVAARDFGVKGTGYGGGYMGNKSVHQDLTTPGPGQDYEWASANRPSIQTSLANARTAYSSSFPAPPAAQAPVASILSTDQPDAAQVALNEYSRPTRATSPATATAATSPAAPSTPAPTSVTDPLSAAAFPTDTVNPTVGLPMRAPRPTPRDAPEYQRTLKGMALATGIDVTGDLLTGGMALAPQLVSYILTGTSIGGNVADAVGGKFGENYYQPGDPLDPRTGRGGMATSETGRWPSSTESGRVANRNGSNAATRSNRSAAGPTTTPEEDFIYKYLDVVSGEEFPTPAEKWWSDRDFGEVP
jgi:hypothetical protein